MEKDRTGFRLVHLWATHNKHILANGNPSPSLLQISQCRRAAEGKDIQRLWPTGQRFFALLPPSHTAIKMLEQLLDTTTLLALCGISFSLYLVAAWINEHLEIKRLGGYAPRVRNYLPLGKTFSLFHRAGNTAADADTGLDLVYRMLKSGHDHKDLDHWSWLFSWAPQSASKTVELNLGGQRSVDIVPGVLPATAIDSL